MTVAVVTRMTVTVRDLLADDVLADGLTVTDTPWGHYFRRDGQTWAALPTDGGPVELPLHDEITVDRPVRYVNRWQFSRQFPHLCVCDICGRPVGPISAGWAHAHATSDDFVLADHTTARHHATVRGNER